MALIARLRAPLRLGLRWTLRAVAWGVALALAIVLLTRWINPPLTPYVTAERLRLGEVRQVWVPLEAISEDMRRAVLAAEDANFCLHWGFDMDAIRSVMAEGGGRGASTISQQVVKNAFLWQGRSWLRKGLEALLTPMAEALWPKRRVLELYLNLAEFDEGVFGVEAAAQHYFGVPASDLSLARASALAVVLPDPKGRSARRPTAFLRQRAAAAADGARTLATDGRAVCVEG